MNVVKSQTSPHRMTSLLAFTQATSFIMAMAMIPGYSMAQRGLEIWKKPAEDILMINSIVFEGLSHFMHLEKPEPVGRIVKSVIAEGRGAVQRAGTILLPSGTPPVIDGTITTEEWQGARRESFSDGSELLLVRRGDDLYLGIRAKTKGLIAGNVFIELSDGIAIHHASAALGTAVYRKDGEVWRLVRNFSWRCRGIGNSEEARAERDAFLREEGWVASTSAMGTPQELEYRIRTGTAPIRLAVTFLSASAPNVKISWPADLDDDCIKPTPRGLPPTLRFSPEKWATIAAKNETGVDEFPRGGPDEAVD